jgi:hypothetical protein
MSKSVSTKSTKTAKKVVDAMMTVAIVYHVYVVRCIVTGWVYVSVRKVSKNAFMSLLKTGARDPNFDQPIHRSFRDHGAEKHTITSVATYDTKEEAQEHQTRMIEANAKRGIGLNAARPGAFATENFVWLSAAAAEEADKAKKARKAKAKKVSPKPEAVTSLSA